MAKKADLRGADRHRVLLKGALVHGPAQLTMDCAISEISAAGARVRTASAAAVVEPIYLVDFTNAQAFKAAIAWRQDGVLGLNFQERYDLRSDDAGVPTILRRLQAEQIRQSPSSERW